MKKKLKLQQLNRKMNELKPLVAANMPDAGWIKTIRDSLNITLQQLAGKMSSTRQAVQRLEMREKTGNITIRSLKEAAKALDMKLVYGFVPNDGSLEALIERKAKELATQIVMRTSMSMKLEGQENSKERIAQSIKERTEELVKEMPKYLWD